MRTSKPRKDKELVQGHTTSRRPSQTSNAGSLALNLPVLFGGLGVHVTPVGVAKTIAAIELD